jgi:serine/threonine protein kinase
VHRHLRRRFHDAYVPSTVVVDGRALDVWALGLSFYAMLYGRLPWPRDGTLASYWDRVISDPIDVSAPFARGPRHPAAEDAWRNLLLGMLEKDAQRRFTAEEARRAAKQLERIYADSSFGQPFGMAPSDKPDSHDA